MVRERGGPAVAARQGPVTEGEYQPDTTVVPLAPIAESVRLAVVGPQVGLAHRSASSVWPGVHPLGS